MCLPAVHQSQRTESEDLAGYAVQSLEQDAEMEAFESMFRLISVETRKINQKIRNIYVLKICSKAHFLEIILFQNDFKSFIGI